MKEDPKEFAEIIHGLLCADCKFYMESYESIELLIARAMRKAWFEGVAARGGYDLGLDKQRPSCPYKDTTAYDAPSDAPSSTTD